MAVASLGACQRQPPAAATNLQLTGDPTWRVLTPQEQRSVRRTMASLAESHEPSPARVKADERDRDAVSAAVERAAERVEMAVISVDTQPHTTRYRLRTIDDRPVWLWIDDDDWPTLRAAATVGWIVDHGPLAGRFLDALDEALGESLDVDLVRMPAHHRGRPAH